MAVHPYSHFRYTIWLSATEKEHINDIVEEYIITRYKFQLTV